MSRLDKREILEELQRRHGVKISELGVDCLQDPLFQHFKFTYMGCLGRYLIDRAQVEIREQEHILTFLDDVNSNIARALLNRYGAGLVYAIEAVLDQIDAELEEDLKEEVTFNEF